jgi:hypothetical protein
MNFKLIQIMQKKRHGANLPILKQELSQNTAVIKKV